MRTTQPFLLLLLAGSCHRAAPLSEGDGGSADGARSAESVTEAPSSVPPVPPPSSTLPVPTAAPLLPPAPSGEAKRTTVPVLEREPILRPFLASLREHFSADARSDAHGPFLLQRIERGGGGGAVLVSRPDESEPIVLAFDRDRLLFARNHPTAGITPPALHVTIAPGPERGVAVFSYVPTQHLVAARMWADDGNPYAEIVTLTTDTCDALSVAYGAGWGWVLACSSSTGTRAQRLREDLTASWGTEGAVVGAVGPVERPTITFDDARTWTLTQRAKAVGGDRTLAFHYDQSAQPMPSSSTSKTSVELGGMTGGKPRAP